MLLNKIIPPVSLGIWRQNFTLILISDKDKVLITSAHSFSKIKLVGEEKYHSIYRSVVYISSLMKYLYDKVTTVNLCNNVFCEKTAPYMSNLWLHFAGGERVQKTWMEICNSCQKPQPPLESVHWYLKHFWVENHSRVC